MSEYQFIHFLAVDRPLDDDQLAFMRQQSTRARISRREFTNEYHFGDFHGDPAKMLRRGFDLHLHYANFGIRRLMFRLPGGLPCDRPAFDAFRVKHALDWRADKKGEGGILELDPEGDADTYEEEVYDPSELLPEIAPLRGLLIGGDLRPLYVGWLACADDDELLEPPVPAGLDKLPRSLEALAELYEVSGDLLAAAAEHSPPLPKATGAPDALETWLAGQSQTDLRKLVRRLLRDDAATVRAETLARIRDETKTSSWPTAEPTRTLAELREKAGTLRESRFEQEQRVRDAARRKRLAAVAADPAKAIARANRLVKARTIDAYEQAAEELAELREAVGPAQARAAAQRLRRDNPKRRHLIAALRRQNLLD
jgi:hypothetical protein